MKKQRVIFKSHDKIECIINGVKVRGEVLVGIARRNNKKRSPANIKFYFICNDKMSNAGMWSKDMAIIP